MTEHYDAIVIGSGAGGGTLARTLAKSGKRILLLERGNFLPRELCNWQPLQVLTAGRYVSQDTWYDAAGNPFEPRVHYFVGGATKLYGAALDRLRPADFREIVHIDGLSPAWPLSYDEFEPWYTKAEWLYQVRGLHGEDPSEGSWSEEYPWPPVSHEPLVQQIADDLDRAGYYPFHVPRGIMLDEMNPPTSLCIRCVTCDGHPCLVHAKADADVIAVRPLLSRLNVTLLVNAEVTRLETDPDGRSVTRVIVRRDGVREEYRGDIVVLAAGAVNSAKILLRSASDRHPAGLANGSGQVGRNYMCHRVVDVVASARNRTRRSSRRRWASTRSTWPTIRVGPRIRPAAPDDGRWAASRCCPGRPSLAREAVAFRLMTEDLPRTGNRVTIDRENHPHLAYVATNRGEAALLRHEFEAMLSHSSLQVTWDEIATAPGGPAPESTIRPGPAGSALIRPRPCLTFTVRPTNWTTCMWRMRVSCRAWERWDRLSPPWPTPSG